MKSVLNLLRANEIAKLNRNLSSNHSVIGKLAYCHLI